MNNTDQKLRIEKEEKRNEKKKSGNSKKDKSKTAEQVTQYLFKNMQKGKMSTMTANHLSKYINNVKP